MSGGVGSMLANPTDLVKARVFSSLFSKRADSVPRLATWSASSVQEYSSRLLHHCQSRRPQGPLPSTVLRPPLSSPQGVVPTMLRAAVLTGSQLSSYDHSKHVILRYDL